MQMDWQAVYHLTGLDRQAVHDAIHEGHYHWAPPTIAGKRRLWGQNDILALAYVVAQMQSGVGKRLAYSRGLTLKRALDDDPDASEVNVEVSVLETVTVTVQALRDGVLDRKIDWIAPQLAEDIESIVACNA